MKSLITVLIVLVSVSAFAEVSVDDGTTKVIFKVGGKIVSPIDAAKAAPDHEVERCNPIKGALNASGSAAEVYKCKAVKLEYSLKTGAPHWKAK